MKKTSFLLAFLACFCASNALQAELPSNPTTKAIIFDLDGVLLTTNTAKATLNLGIINLMRYILFTGSTPSKNALFEVLYPIPGLSRAYAEHEGKPMPQIMLDWQTSTQTNEQLLTSCLQHFDTQYEAGKLSTAQINIFKPMVTLMFDTQIYTESKSTIPLNIQALQTLADYAKEHGIKLFVLSNWDKESLPLVKEKFPEIFTHFKDEHIIISGHIGLVKPNPDFFNHMLTKHNLKAEECLFIDDEHTNIKSAKNLGLKTVLCTPQVSKNLLLHIEKLV